METGILRRHVCRRLPWAATAIALIFMPTAWAGIVPWPTFHDGIALPCSSPVPIWGTATPGETISIAFAGQTVTTVADQHGRWMVRLAPLDIDRHGRDLILTEKNIVTLHQITVAGEDIAGKPFWTGDTIDNEPLLFIQETGQPTATAVLLLTPTSAPRLTDSSGTIEYKDGVDYTWDAGAKTIALTAQSRIAFKTRAEMYPEAGKPGTFGQIGTTGTGTLWHEGSYFHQLQVLATYQHHDHWNGIVPPNAGGRLKRTLAKLDSKAPFKVVALGDSITAGYNSSGLVDAPPYRPAYPDLVASGLRHRFGAPVSLVNLAVAGTGAEWGFGRVADVVAQKPDLVILAFGMNDGVPAPFAASIAKTLAALQDGCPDADVILVASMVGNPDIFPHTNFDGRRDALLKLQGDNVAVANVTSLWEDLAKHKPFQSLTGNNVNHPNDFSHQVYANVILALFDSQPKANR